MIEPPQRVRDDREDDLAARFGRAKLDTIRLGLDLLAGDELALVPWRSDATHAAVFGLIAAELAAGGDAELAARYSRAAGGCVASASAQRAAAGSA